VYVIGIGDAARVPVQLIIHRLRCSGHHVVSDLQRRSVKAQMKDANRAGVAFTVMIGDDEIASSTAVIKNMLTGEQMTVAQTEIETVMGRHE
jgi:histidyl-tRNA synthetase